MKKIFLIGLVLVVFIGAGVGGFRWWRAHVIARTEARAHEAAARLLRDGQPLRAIAIFEQEPRTDVRFNWSGLELEALTAARHVSRLVGIFEQNPNRVLAHEEASLFVARAFLAAQQPEQVDRVRNAWRGREQRPELWLALDSDQLALGGDVPAAERLLRKSVFTGEAEALRLVRLSLHAARRDLREAWTFLDRAAVLAPRNPEVRSYRGQVLEAIGRTAEARVEYVAAHVADPRNPLLRDELAEFYRRQGCHDLALQTWRDAMTVPAPDFVWLKEAFWSRVIQPAATPAVAAHLSVALAPLAEFVRSLPSGQFWDEAAFAQLPDAPGYRRDRAEVFWLSLIEDLRRGDEAEAATRLRSNRRPARSWDPQLELALARILQFRSRQTLVVPDRAPVAVATNRHSFFGELERWAKADGANRGDAALPKELTTLLKGRDAFAAAFLAAGWREAALALSDPKGDASGPVWFAYGLAQCLRQNRGNAAALEFLKAKSNAPELALLRAELLVAEGRVPEGLRGLAEWATADSDVGFRAAWLLASAEMEGGQLEAARATILRQPRLARSTTGREQFARLASLGGQVAEAERQYRAIEADSIEARAFLARRAFELQDWAAARRQTEALLRQMPDELQLRENLLAIAKAEGTHASR